MIRAATRTEDVKQLITAKANVSAPRYDGVTPLYITSQDGHTGVVQQLLAAKADVNAVKKDGTTTLQIASLKHHAKIVGILKAYGAR